MTPPADGSQVEVLQQVLAQVSRVAPGEAAHALAAASEALHGRASLADLRAAAENLRAAYERLAPPRTGCVRTARHAHDDRRTTPWADPCDDPAWLRPLAACVAAVYAVEAWAEGWRLSRQGYYVRAAWEWSTEGARES